jgi:quercetin dioxygenase-like cupin family protein
MADGFVLPPGAGHRIRGAGMTLKVGAEQSGRWSAFEAEVAPGFDVGAHRHAEAEEIFYLLEGELDLLAFEPRTTAPGDWTAWESAGGARVVRGGPGSLMFVPAGCPHAFTNPGAAPARMLFLVTPAGHELYLEGIAELLSRPGPPDQAAIIELRARYDIEQLTSMIPDRRQGGRLQGVLELTVPHQAEARRPAGYGAVVGDQHHGQAAAVPQVLEQGDDLVRPRGQGPSWGPRRRRRGAGPGCGAVPRARSGRSPRRPAGPAAPPRAGSRRSCGRPRPGR